MGDGIEVRDSVITGGVSINTNPIRVECPSCRKSGMLILHLCERQESDCCYERICDTCFDENPICTPCRELIALQEQEKEDEATKAKEQAVKSKQEEKHKLRIDKAKEELDQIEADLNPYYLFIVTSIFSLILLAISYILNNYTDYTKFGNWALWCGYIYLGTGVIGLFVYFRHLYLVNLLSEEE